MRFEFNIASQDEYRDIINWFANFAAGKGLYELTEKEIEEAVTYRESLGKRAAFTRQTNAEGKAVEQNFEFTVYNLGDNESVANALHDPIVAKFTFYPLPPR